MLFLMEYVIPDEIFVVKKLIYFIIKMLFFDRICYVQRNFCRKQATITFVLRVTRKRI